MCVPSDASVVESAPLAAAGLPRRVGADPDFCWIVRANGVASVAKSAAAKRSHDDDVLGDKIGAGGFDARQRHSSPLDRHPTRADHRLHRAQVHHRRSGHRRPVRVETRRHRAAALPRERTAVDGAERCVAIRHRRPGRRRARAAKCCSCPPGSNTRCTCSRTPSSSTCSVPCGRIGSTRPTTTSGERDARIWSDRLRLQRPRPAGSKPGTTSESRRCV